MKTNAQDFFFFKKREIKDNVLLRLNFKIQALIAVRI